MEDFLHNTLNGWLILSAYMAAFAAVFFLLSRLFPLNPGIRWWRRDALVTDLCYWFLVPLAGRFVKIALIVLGTSYLLGLQGAELDDFLSHGYGPLSQLPIWLQAVLILVLSDIPLYFIHRAFHGGAMWRYHAVHHSPVDLDWISTMRFHPINTWLYSLPVDVAMVLIGFSPEAMLLLAPFNICFSAFVHANLNWSLGPLKYVISTPVFHRWHHTAANEGGMRNFAPTFPILDILFGTFYMPKDRLPEKYGVDDPHFPEGFLEQMIYPFRKPATGAALQSGSSADSAGPGQTPSAPASAPAATDAAYTPTA